MGVLLPIKTSETWAEHFTNNSWTTPQDQIDDGYPLFCMPTPTSGEYSEVFDFGSAVAAARASVSATTEILGGTPTITISTDVSADGTTWTTGDGLAAVFATDVRYVRARVEVSGGLVQVNDLSAKLDGKLKNDGGSATAAAAETSGTWVPFNVAFMAVTAVTPTPSGTTAAYAVANYDAGDPSGFRVLLFNAFGTRISGPVFWSAKGY